MGRLNFWIVKVGEPAVFNNKQSKRKPLRAAMISQILSNLDNDVTWWTSNFQHHDKSLIFDNNVFNRDVYKGITIEYIPSTGYRKNLSFKRFLDHKILAKNVSSEIKSRVDPDLIFCAWPLVELTEVFYNFAKNNNIPFVIDVRDQWPDVIYRRVFESIGLGFKLNFLPSYERVLKKCFVGADAVITISPPFLEWVYKRSGRLQNSKDMVCRLSSKDLYNTVYEKNNAEDFWKEKGVINSEEILRIVMVGTLVRQKSLLNFLKVVQGNDFRNFQFVVCGSGQLEKEIININNDNLIFAGYVDEGQMSHLFKMSDVGLLPYDNTEDFLMSIPNKVGEYLSCGLHLLTSLRGEVFDFFKKSDMATFYNHNHLDEIKVSLENIYDDRETIRNNKSLSRGLYLKNLNAKKNYKELAMHLENIAQNI